MTTRKWQPPFMPDYDQQTAALMMEARNRGWSDSKIKNRFQDMGVDLGKMAGYSLSQKSPQQQLGLLKNTQRKQASVADKMREDWSNNSNLLNLGSGIYTQKGSGNSKSWWDTIGSTLGDMGGSLWDSAKDIGLKDGLKLATDVAKIPLGYKMVGLAEDENKLAASNLAFQKDAFWKNYGNQVTAYNQIAYDRQAFKDAQDPKRERYAQETIIPV
jgi:hypothetical protein